MMWVALKHAHQCKTCTCVHTHGDDFSLHVWYILKTSTEILFLNQSLGFWIKLSLSMWSATIIVVLLWKPYPHTHPRSLNGCRLLIGVGGGQSIIPFHQSAAIQLAMGHTHHSVAHTLWGNSDSPINLMCMFLGCGRKLEYLEKTHTDTGRTH